MIGANFLRLDLRVKTLRRHGQITISFQFVHSGSEPISSISRFPARVDGKTRYRRGEKGISVYFSNRKRFGKKGSFEALFRVLETSLVLNLEMSWANCYS